MAEALDPNRLREVGDWSEQISSSGKRYFYNSVTEVSQWAKPPEWEAAEKRLEEEQQQQRARAAAEAEARAEPERPPETSASDCSPSVVAMDVVDEEEEEEEGDQEWKRFYNPARAAELSKKIFQDDNPNMYKDLAISQLEHEIRISEKKSVARKAEIMVNTSMMRSTLLETKIKLLRESQADMEKQRAEKMDARNSSGGGGAP